KKDRGTALVSTKEHARPRNIGGTEVVDDLRLTLDKTKRLLALQSKISSDYKKELEILQNEVKERRNECEDLKQMLDLKNDKIKKLESRLAEVAYRRNRPFTGHTPVPISSTEMFEVQSNSTINISTTKHASTNEHNNKLLEGQYINDHSTAIETTSSPQTATQHVPSHSTDTHFTPVSLSPSTVSHSPTGSPTQFKTGSPTRSPTGSPTQFRTGSPPQFKTGSPTPSPTGSPTHLRSGSPTQFKTGSPTRSPTGLPTHFRTSSPTQFKTGSPTQFKIGSPTQFKIGSPTRSSTGSPTQFRTGSPTQFKTGSPTHSPTGVSSDVTPSLRDSVEVSPSPPVSPHVRVSPGKDRLAVTDDTLFGDSSFEEEDIPLPDITPTEDSLSEDEVKYKNDSPVLLHEANDLLSTKLNTEEVFFSLTIISFTLEEDAAVLSDPNVNNIFVEYSFLDYDIDELETPVSLPKPPPGQPAIFNFTTDFHILPMSNSMNLLQEFLLSNEPIIELNLVHDPQEEDDNDNIECQELGTANLKLLEILQSEEGDSVVVDEDVLSVADPDEMMGFLTIQISGLKSLKQLSDKLIKK
uniref:RPGRIP1 C-terminal domain-containing protein n=2 Tax=Amphimedon queenslandica TaxID=400682 RepID=A0A1X7U1H0_AMPQE